MKYGPLDPVISQLQTKPMQPEPKPMPTPMPPKPVKPTPPTPPKPMPPMPLKPTYAAPPNRPNLTAMANSLPKAPPVGTNPTYAAPPKPMPMPAVPPKGYVDDLDFLKKITSNQPRNTSGSTPKITPYNPMETNTIPPTGTTSTPMPATGPQYMKKGGKVKSSSASSRGDGIAQRGKTKGRFV